MVEKLRVACYGANGHQIVQQLADHPRAELVAVSKIDADKSVAVINSIKTISAMDIAEKRRPQDGSFMARTQDASIYFRVATAGVMGGEKISIRVLNQILSFAAIEIRVKVKSFCVKSLEQDNSRGNFPRSVPALLPLRQ